ncbi:MULTISPECIES: D-serine ammonia-lyase [Lysinibacillus]|uniref:D-serine ammonia-lyase n=1 Tax=Lysinibacillus TaxID=400634 RepID=UPI000B0F4304|nr:MULTISPECIES: D-serine ammonia-lyase [Lysinibacillus]
MQTDNWKSPIIKRLENMEELVWINPKKESANKPLEKMGISTKDIDDARIRLERFAPFIECCFPETKATQGIIESPLTAIPMMQKFINESDHCNLTGTLLLKQDNELAIAGSVKARGGIYEVLKHTEDLALFHGLLRKEDNYAKLASKECRHFFQQYTIQVGSTGNLGLSIGMVSVAIGYKVIIHMSSDAEQWKKDLLRKHGVVVVEYQSDYSVAVKNGRVQSDKDPKSYFIDDENSIDLFLGYAVAAKRLELQLKEQGLIVNEEHPLFVYIPCGVGGAPGGITFGLKDIFGENVHCFFVEPTKAPCMLLGMASGKHDEISVNDIGLDGQTLADGLAVGRASGFIGKVMEPILSGIFTVEDCKLFEYMRHLLNKEQIFLEPSACAAFEGVMRLSFYDEMSEYLANCKLEDKIGNATHIVWATGGSLVPDKNREEYINTYVGD